MRAVVCSQAVAVVAGSPIFHEGCCPFPGGDSVVVVFSLFIASGFVFCDITYCVLSYF